MLYGLGNLVENAVDFARTQGRSRRQHWTESSVSVIISDDGPGFAPEILSQLGEPYVTTRGADRKAKIDEASGLGLGLFIAKTLLERSGATSRSEIAAIRGPARRSQIEWPREAFERNQSDGGAVGRTIEGAATP